MSQESTTAMPIVDAHQRTHPGGGHARSIQRHYQHGNYHQLRPGHYVNATIWNDADPLERYIEECRAAAEARRASTGITHSSAAAVLGLPVRWQTFSHIHLTYPQNARARRYRAIVPHFADLADNDLTYARGMVVTTPERTAVDMCLTAEGADALAVVDAVLRATPTHVEETRIRLLTVLDQLPALRHRAAAEGIIRLGSEKSESAGESRTRQKFDRLGVVPPQLQYEIETDSGQFRADFCWPDEKVVCEFDGLQKYQDPRLLGRRTPADIILAEKARESAIAAAGFRVVRVLWSDVDNESRLAAILRTAGVPFTSRAH